MKPSTFLTISFYVKFLVDTSDSFQYIFYSHQKGAFMTQKNFFMRKILYVFFAVALTVILFSVGFSNNKVNRGSKNSNSEISSDSIHALADYVWEFSKKHPDGFTLNLRNMAEPTTGIVVSYASTQSSILREQLDSVVFHALSHDKYIGGWLDVMDSLYYFDSNRLFSEDSLDDAIAFGKENLQKAVFVLSKGEEVRIEY